MFRVPTGRRTTIRTVEGIFTVEPLDDTTALAALPSALARPAIVRELRTERRADAYAAWTIRMQKAAESKLVCERDRLPRARRRRQLVVRAVPLALGARGRSLARRPARG